MGFSQLESKKIVDACLRNITKTAKSKDGQEEKIRQIKLQLELLDAVLNDTEKRKKKNKKRKVSDDGETSSIEIVEPGK